MPKPKLTVIIESGTPRMSWCNGCLTSARYELDVYALGDDGPLCLGTAHGCERCGPDKPAGDPSDHLGGWPPPRGS